MVSWAISSTPNQNPVSAPSGIIYIVFIPKVNEDVKLTYEPAGTYLSLNGVIADVVKKLLVDTDPPLTENSAPLLVWVKPEKFIPLKYPVISKKLDELLP